MKITLPAPRHDPSDELRIGAMVRALHGIDLDNPTARAAAYVRANALAKGDL